MSEVKRYAILRRYLVEQSDLLLNKAHRIEMVESSAYDAMKAERDRAVALVAELRGAFYELEKHLVIPGYIEEVFKQNKTGEHLLDLREIVGGLPVMYDDEEMYSAHTWFTVKFGVEYADAFRDLLQWRKEGR